MADEPTNKYLQWLKKSLIQLYTGSLGDKSLIEKYAIKGIFIQIFLFKGTEKILAGLYYSPYSPNGKKIFNYLLRNQDKILIVNYKYDEKKSFMKEDFSFDEFLYEKMPKFPINYYLILFQNDSVAYEVLQKIADNLEDINDKQFIEEIPTFFLTQKKRKNIKSKQETVIESKQEPVNEKEIVNLFETKKKKKKSKKTQMITPIEENDIPIIENDIPIIENELTKGQITGQIPMIPQMVSGASGDNNWMSVESKQQERIPDFTFYTTVEKRLIEKDGRMTVDYHNPELKACPENFNPLTFIQGLLILIVGNKKLTDAEKFKRLLNCLYLRYRSYNEHGSKTSEIGKEHLRYIKDVASVLFIFCEKIDVIPHGNKQTKINWFFDQLQSIPFLETLRSDIEDYNRSHSSQRGLIDNQLVQVTGEMNILTNVKSFDLPIFNPNLTGVQEHRFRDVKNILFERGREHSSVSESINNMMNNIYNRFRSKSGTKKKDSPDRRNYLKNNLLKKDVKQLKSIAKYLGCKNSSKLLKLELVNFIINTI